MEKSIEELKEKIVYDKTKEYFVEIEKSFYIENYRSAIVMLYSLVIFDLLYKLNYLKTHYDDKIAKNIIDEIEKNKIKNPEYPKWEKILIDEIKKIQLLDSEVFINIENLKKKRNIYAHPSLNKNGELSTPNREEVLGLIKNMIAGIFIIPPLIIENYTQKILLDISNLNNKYYFLNNYDKLKIYLSNNYFKNMSEKVIFQIFKAFWKFSFRIENEECNFNRNINIMALRCMCDLEWYKIHQNIIKESGNITEKNNDINNLNQDLFAYLIKFFCYFPEFYEKLDERNKFNLKIYIEKNPKYIFFSYYKYSTLEEYIEQLKLITIENIEDFKIKRLIEEKIEKDGKINLLVDKYIEIFGESNSYDSADRNFSDLIKDKISIMNFTQIEKLIEYINNNNQLYNRNRAYYDNNEIIENANIIWDKFDLQKYKKFKFSKEKLKLKLTIDLDNINIDDIDDIDFDNINFDEKF